MERPSIARSVPRGNPPRAWRLLRATSTCAVLTSVVLWGITAKWALCFNLCKRMCVGILYGGIVFTRDSWILSIWPRFHTEPSRFYICFWPPILVSQFHVRIDMWLVVLALGGGHLLLRRHARTAVQRHANECPACGYSLTGNISGICPECGTPVAGMGHDGASVARR